MYDKCVWPNMVGWTNAQLGQKMSVTISPGIVTQLTAIEH